MLPNFTLTVRSTRNNHFSVIFSILPHQYQVLKVNNGIDLLMFRYFRVSNFRISYFCCLVSVVVCLEWSKSCTMISRYIKLFYLKRSRTIPQAISPLSKLSYMLSYVCSLISSLVSVHQCYSFPLIIWSNFLWISSLSSKLVIFSIIHLFTQLTTALLPWF